MDWRFGEAAEEAGVDDRKPGPGFRIRWCGRGGGDAYARKRGESAKIGCGGGEELDGGEETMYAEGRV